MQPIKNLITYVTGFVTDTVCYPITELRIETEQTGLRSADVAHWMIVGSLLLTLFTPM
jgi:hypothetical protein